jgi:hypothetical protein
VVVKWFLALLIGIGKVFFFYFFFRFSFMNLV